MITILLSVLIAMMYLALGLLTFIIAFYCELGIDVKRKRDLFYIQGCLCIVIATWPAVLPLMLLSKLDKD